MSLFAAIWTIEPRKDLYSSRRLTNGSILYDIVICNGILISLFKLMFDKNSIHQDGKLNKCILSQIYVPP